MVPTSSDNRTISAHEICVLGAFDLASLAIKGYGPSLRMLEIAVSDTAFGLSDSFPLQYLATLAIALAVTREAVDWLSRNHAPPTAERLS